MFLTQIGLLGVDDLYKNFNTTYDSCSICKTNISHKLGEIMILVKPVLILILSIAFNSLNFAAGAADFAPMLQTFAQAGLQYQQQSKQFDQQKNTQQSKINEINAATSTQTANADMTSPYGTGATPPVAAAGYPLLDPYSNPQYWAQRGQQFKFSMDVASKRSEAMNDMAKIQLEQEKKKQEMMMKGIGTLMKTAGSTMGQMAKDKALKEKQEAAALEEKVKADNDKLAGHKKLVSEHESNKEDVKYWLKKRDSTTDPTLKQSYTNELVTAQKNERATDKKVKESETTHKDLLTQRAENNKALEQDEAEETTNMLNTGATN